MASTNASRPALLAARMQANEGNVTQHTQLVIVCLCLCEGLDIDCHVVSILLVESSNLASELTFTLQTQQ